MNNKCAENKAEKLINKLNEAMQDMDVKQIALAKKLNVEKNSLNLYLNKKRKMPLWLALDIAHTLQVDISDVCGITKKINALHYVNGKPIDYVLSDSETLLLLEIRRIKSPAIKERAIKEFTELAKLLNW